MDAARFQEAIAYADKTESADGYDAEALWLRAIAYGLAALLEQGERLVEGSQDG